VRSDYCAGCRGSKVHSHAALSHQESSSNRIQASLTWLSTVDGMCYCASVLHCVACKSSLKCCLLHVCLMLCLLEMCIKHISCAILAECLPRCILQRNKPCTHRNRCCACCNLLVPICASKRRPCDDRGELSRLLRQLAVPHLCSAAGELLQEICRRLQETYRHLQETCRHLQETYTEMPYAS
jgi:hypothetical protein